MESIAVKDPPGLEHNLNLVNGSTTPQWTAATNQENPTFLYIVEYVKDEYKMEINKMEEAHHPTPLEPFSGSSSSGDFRHVSSLDPNMGSVAGYSPAYAHGDQAAELVSMALVNQTQPNSLINPNSVLCDDNNTLTVISGSNASQENNGPEVELLITDQETGISYSIVRSELLVDDHLLNFGGDPLSLDPDLLGLDDGLKGDFITDQLSDDLKQLESGFRMETRSRSRQVVPGGEQDPLLLPSYTINDKPLLTPARASLPELYLAINKSCDGFGVFAKRNIPKRTQFGPLAGILNDVKEAFAKAPGDLLYFIEDEGQLKTLDVSDENYANWMSFVRKAADYSEQNLLMTQEGTNIFFTTTRNISPKQELKVGYSAQYATRFNLTVLPAPAEEKTWTCFECPLAFESSVDLQKHLDVHDDLKPDENSRPRLWRSGGNNNNNNNANNNNNSVTIKKRLLLKSGKHTLRRCNECDEIFLASGKIAFRQHLLEKHIGSKLEYVEEYFTTLMNYRCLNCDLVFHSEPLLRIHNFLHNSDTSEERTNHICPSCQRKFPTQRQLVTHVAAHATPVSKITHIPTYKCQICHKLFAQGDRLRRHMMVHGSDDIKPLQCKTCQKRFLNKSALAVHLKTHFVGKKNFHCPICKDSFDNVIELKIHVPIHSDNNTYRCPHCHKIFKKYSIIRKHIRAFHGEQKQSCQYCTKQFPSVDKLKMHLLKHSDHREFLCSDCGKQFKRKDKLNEHCKRMHSEERENVPKAPRARTASKKKSSNRAGDPPTDFHRFIYKCHACMIGFKRRGMLVNHLAKKHPDVKPDSVPELNLPILQTTRDYYCPHCENVYKSSSKRKAHILKNHPGAALPVSNRKQPNNGGNNSGGGDAANFNNPTFSQTVGSITTKPQNCKWCHKQYASKAKLLQHERKKHGDMLSAKGTTTAAARNGGGAGVVVSFFEVDEDEDDYKVTVDEEFLQRAIDSYEDADSNLLQSCQVVALGGESGGGGGVLPSMVCGGELATPNSHLFRLLTTTSDMVPPR